MKQQVLEESPHSGALFAFRGKRGDLVKLLWYDGQGMCLFPKRMDRGRFVWPSTKTGSVVMMAAQLSMLLEGIDWRRPERTFTSAIRPRCRMQAFPPLSGKGCSQPTLIQGMRS
jgi:transposase